MRELKKRMSYRDFAECVAAKRLGLLTDPATQTASIVRTLYQLLAKYEAGHEPPTLEECRVRYAGD